MKINLKWIKDLNVRPDTINPLEENTGRTLPDMNHSNIFLDQSPKAIKIKTKISKWDIIKLKSFYIAKETIKKKNKTTHRTLESLCKMKRIPFNKNSAILGFLWSF